MKQTASSSIWELEEKKRLSLTDKNQVLLKQKTQDFVPSKTFPVPELIQKLPSLQPLGSSCRSMSEGVKS
jgi:hypothetical protein